MFILRMFFMYWQTGEQVARMIWPLGESRIKAALAATKKLNSFILLVKS